MRLGIEAETPVKAGISQNTDTSDAFLRQSGQALSNKRAADASPLKCGSNGERSKQRNTTLTAIDSTCGEEHMAQQRRINQCSKRQVALGTIQQVLNEWK
jgi:hypothetical protein